jgi:hypothetical protein
LEFKQDQSSSQRFFTSGKIQIFPDFFIIFYIGALNFIKFK